MPKKLNVMTASHDDKQFECLSIKKKTKHGTQMFTIMSSHKNVLPAAFFRRLFHFCTEKNGL